MSKLNADQIAELFSKGQECAFWLTQKQTDWLLNVAMREHGQPSRLKGRRWGLGYFENNNGSFHWECNEGNHNNAMLKVWKTREEGHQITYGVTVKDFQAFVKNQGYNFNEIMNTPLMGELAVEFSRKLNQ